MENYERDRLGIEEFFSEVLYLVSRKIVSEQYIQENEDFINSFISDLYDAYLAGSSIKILSDIVENMFHSMFIHKPGLENL